MFIGVCVWVWVCSDQMLFKLNYIHKNVATQSTLYDSCDSCEYHSALRRLLTKHKQSIHEEIMCSDGMLN